MRGFHLPSAHQLSLLQSLPLTRHQVRDGWPPCVVQSLESAWLMEWTEESLWEITELGRLVTGIAALSARRPSCRASTTRTARGGRGRCVAPSAAGSCA